MQRKTQPPSCALRVPRVIFINPQPLFQISHASSYLDRYEDAWVWPWYFSKVDRLNEYIDSAKGGSHHVHFKHSFEIGHKLILVLHLVMETVKEQGNS